MAKRTIISILLLATAGLIRPADARACTNFLISRGATVDGSTMISYAADSHVLYGALYHPPAPSCRSTSGTPASTWARSIRSGTPTR